MFQVVKPKEGKGEVEGEEGTEPSGRRRRKRATAIATTNRCNVEQIPNRDYTEPAYNIELDVNDDRLVIYFYHIIQICSGITCGRLLSGEVYAQRAQKLFQRVKRNLHGTVCRQMQTSVISVYIFTM